MDLTELRASHPGLYEQAVQQGIAQENARVCEHLKLAAGCGGSPIRAVEQGWSAAEALPYYRGCAAKDDERASAFLRVVAALGLEGDQPGGSMTGAAKRLAASMGQGPRVGSLDPAARVAEIVTGRKADGSPADPTETPNSAKVSDVAPDEAARRVAEIVAGKPVAS